MRSPAGAGWLGITLAVGFCLGWFVHAPQVPTTIHAGASLRASPSLPRADAPVTATDEALAANLDVAAGEANSWRRQLRLAAVTANLDRDEVVAALDREQARASYARTPVITALMARLAELDPPGAALRAMQWHEGADLGTVLDFWVEQNSGEAIAWVQGLPKGQRRGSAVVTLTTSLTERDPEEALRVALLLGDGREYSWVIASVFVKLAQQNPRAAAERVWSLSTSAQQETSVGAVAGAWAEQDPHAALDWVTQLPAGQTRENATSKVYSAWANNDPAAAGAALLARGIGYPDKNVAAELAGQWAAKDLSAARAWAEGLPVFCRADAMTQVLSSWAEADPAGAVEYARLYPDPERREQMLANTVGGWAGKDLTAAVEWAVRQPPGPLRGRAVEIVAGNWGQDDPAGCLGFLLKNETAEELKNNYQMMESLGNWSRTRPAEALQWSQALADPALRDQAMGGVILELVASDPAQAVAQLGQLSPDHRKDTVDNLASRWTARDPQAATDWIRTLPAGEERGAAVASAVSDWAGNDVSAAARWLASAPPGDVTDPAIQGLVQHLAKADPRSAAVWAERMQDDFQRENTLMNIARTWLEADPMAAKAWIANTPGLTPEDRAQLAAKPQADL